MSFDDLHNSHKIDLGIFLKPVWCLNWTRQCNQPGVWVFSVSNWFLIGAYIQLINKRVVVTERLAVNSSKLSNQSANQPVLVRWSRRVKILNNQLENNQLFIF